MNRRTSRRAKRATCCRPTGGSRSRSCAARACACTTRRAASTSTCCPGSASRRSATRTRGWRARSRNRPQTLLHTSNLFFHPLQGQLAERLADLSGLPRAFFCNSGTEAVEACLKFARRYWYTRGEPRTRDRRARGVVPRPDDRRAVGDLRRALSRAVRAAAVRCHVRRRRTIPAALAAAVSDEHGGDHRRADSGRRRRPAADAGVRRGDQRGVARGRARSSSPTKCSAASGGPGYPFYFAALGLKPHLVSLGKALGGGVPVGAALVSEEVAATISFGDHGSTYGGNLLACRAALCVLDELVGGGLHRARRRASAAISSSGCARWRRKHAIVKEVRGVGPHVGPRADARRGARRAGGARAGRHRQSHGRDASSGCCRRSSSPKPRPSEALDRLDAALGAVTPDGGRTG